MYQQRIYRNKMDIDSLNKYHVIQGESDLLIFSSQLDLAKVEKYLKNCRDDILRAISQDNNFLTSLTPIDLNSKMPKIVKDMVLATSHYKVGPMAAVAGAIAQYLGRYIKGMSEEVIIENGGDIYISTKSEKVIKIYSKDKVYEDKLEIILKPDQKEVALCTSSGKLGHSKSFGNSDAVMIKAEDAILADAAATAFANKLQSKRDIERVLSQAKDDKYIMGIIILIDGNLGVWGDIEFRERN